MSHAWSVTASGAFPRNTCRCRGASSLTARQAAGPSGRPLASVNGRFIPEGYLLGVYAFEADARLIVRAVNSHYSLLALCEEALKLLPFANLALAKAKEG